MKKTQLLLAAAIVTLGLAWTSCNSPSDKVANAQNDVKAANADLDAANKELLAEINKYKAATADSIEQNDKSIAEFDARIDKQKVEARDEYRKKITELDKKNNDMKKRMDDFKAGSKEDWEAFKKSFSQDMHSMNQGIRNFFKSDKN
jgi:hypothetical protein